MRLDIKHTICNNLQDIKHDKVLHLFYVFEAYTRTYRVPVGCWSWVCDCAVPVGRAQTGPRESFDRRVASQRAENQVLSRACPPHRGRSAWWPRTSAAVSDVARLHVGLSSMKATEREVAELSAGISAAGREEVLLERDKITKDALSAGRRRPTGRQLLSRCTPLTHRSRSSIAHRV